MIDVTYKGKPLDPQPQQAFLHALAQLVVDRLCAVQDEMIRTAADDDGVHDALPPSITAAEVLSVLCQILGAELHMPLAAFLMWVLRAWETSGPKDRQVDDAALIAAVREAVLKTIPSDVAMSLMSKDRADAKA